MFAGTPNTYLHVCDSPWSHNKYHHEGDNAVWTTSNGRHSMLTATARSKEFQSPSPSRGFPVFSMMCRNRNEAILRNVVEMYQASDRSLKEVAELAGISVTATKSRLLRARKTLRRAIERKDSIIL